MTPFLKQVALHYFSTEPMQTLCFIFPNRRSLAFFRKWLAEAVADPLLNASAPGHEGTPRPVELPPMYTMNDFFHLAAATKQVDRVEAMLILYECYRKSLSEGMEPDSLDDFIYWGDVLMSDFNDVDKYLADPHRIFTNISEFRALDAGLDDLDPVQKEAILRLVRHFKQTGSESLDFEDKSVKKNFLRIWDMLLPIYTAFGEALTARGLSYEGMAYRSLATRMREGSAVDILKEKFNGCSKFVFVGLNALNECEKAVMRKMRDAGLAQFCWDYSGAMLKDPENQASKFMRDRFGTGNLDQFPQAFEFDTQGLPLTDINIYSVPSSTGQACLIPEILREISVRAGEHDVPETDTAIVIPDEALLMPVLNSIPPQVKDINVTMGYPMSGSGLFSLMSQIATLQLHTRRYRDGSYSFYHKQVWSIFASEVFRAAISGGAKEKMDEIRAAAQFYIPQEGFKGDAWLEIVFRPVVKEPTKASAAQTAAFGAYLLEVVTALGSRISGNPMMSLEVEFARRYYSALNLLMAKSLDITPATFTRLLSMLLGSISVPFNGEPLSGLQIMGPLETRALDFTNLIILSCNEGTFPSRNVSSSFIPPELRTGFGLPTYEYQDRIWAYYFYRMIQRAKSVYLVYDSRAEGTKAGEESRYIKQLEYLYGHRYTDIGHKRLLSRASEQDEPACRTRRYTATADIENPEPPEIHKVPEDVRIIQSRHLSASSLKKFLDCPAQFYYAVVKGLSKEDEVSESLDGGMIGSIYHEVMQSIFIGEQAMSPDCDLSSRTAAFSPMSFVSADYLRSWRNRPEDIEAKIIALIKRSMKTIEVSGRDLVTKKLILEYVMKTLSKDIEYLKDQKENGFTIYGLEKKYEWDHGGFKFIGYIDRIDGCGARVRVVDYKTGRVEDEEKILVGGEVKSSRKTPEQVVEGLVNKLFDPVPAAGKPKIALQLYLYDKFIKEGRSISGGDSITTDKSREKELVEGKTLMNSIYQVSSLFKDPVSEAPVGEAFIDQMDQGLDQLLGRLSSTEENWIRTTDAENTCKYCDFKTLCGR